MNLKTVALSSVMTSLAVVGRVLLVILPNVSPVAPLTILSGYIGGPITGFLVGFLSMFISDMYIGIGPHTIVTSLSMGFIGFLGGLFLRHVKDRTLLFISTLLLTLLYDVSTSIFIMAMFGVSPFIALINLFLPVFLGGIPYPMGPVHEFTTAFLFVSLYDVLSSYSLFGVVRYER